MTDFLSRIIVLFFLLYPFTSYSQQRIEGVNELIEQIVNNLDEPTVAEETTESLLYYFHHPLNLNKANYDDFILLNLLSSSEIFSILNHRSKHGDFLSIYELQAIEGVPFSKAVQLGYFVEVNNLALTRGSEAFLKRLLDAPNKYILVRARRKLQLEEEFQEGEYLGSPERWQLRFRATSKGDFSINLLMEKDEGEEIKWQPKNNDFGADFTTFHCMLEDRGKLKKLVIGDYQYQAGQGLVLSAGFVLGKGASTVSGTQRANSGVRPYTSSMEQGYMRGVLTTWEVSPHISSTFFYDRDREDASLDALGKVESISFTGWHRTAKEEARKDKIVRQSIGMRHLYTPNPTTQLGITTHHTYYDKFIPQGKEYYQSYHFSGKKNYTIGIDYKKQLNNIVFFGESAISKSGGKGWVNGINASFSNNFEWALVTRIYEKYFHSFKGNSFGENSQNVNEEGVYLGVNWKLSKPITIQAYADVFRHRWLKYQTSTATNGTEHLLKINYRFSRKTQLYFQYRIEKKELDKAVNDTEKIGKSFSRIREGYILNATHKTDRKIAIRTRFQVAGFQHDSPKKFGYLGLQDFTYYHRKYTLSLRFAVFHTEDYDTRLYVYEKDVWGVFSIPAYYGKGYRQVVLLQYKFNRKMNVWIRYASTINEQSINNDSQIIKSNVHLQCKYDF